MAKLAGFQMFKTDEVLQCLRNDYHHNQPE